MILGYEQPIDIPVQSIYDKPMMQMYLQALQKDYEQGVAEQKEFLSNFGNFTSPIAADVDAWNERTIDPIREYLDQNPDALRSVEGRNAISRFIATRPYGDLAKLRQSAENAKAYQKAVAEMQSKGLYNPELEKLFGKGLGINDWNTLENGMWDRQSPIEFKTLNQYTTHLFDNLKDSDLGPSPKDKRYRRSGVTEEQMRPIVDYSMDDLLSSPLGQFYYNSAKNDLIRQGVQNPTDQEIRNKFADNVITANKERIHVTDEADEFAKMDYQYNKQMALQKQKAQDAENLAKLKARLNGINGNGLTDPNYNYIQDNAVNNIQSVYGQEVGKQIYTGLIKGDGRALMLYQATTLKQHGGKGSAYHQSLHLAGKEDNAGFYARLGMQDTGSLSHSESTGSTKNGGVAENDRINRSKGVNSGILVNNDINISRRLVTLRDVSTLAYGSRKLTRATIRKTSNGNSRLVSEELKKKGANGNSAMHNEIDVIKPVGGDKNIIYQVNNDGTYHAYRKVNVKLKNGNQINGLWFDYGEVEWRDDAAKATTRRFKKDLGVSDTKNIQTLTNSDFDD